MGRPNLVNSSIASLDADQFVAEIETDEECRGPAKPWNTLLALRVLRWYERENS